MVRLSKNIDDKIISSPPPSKRMETKSIRGNSVKFSSRNCIRSSGLAFNIGLGAWRAARLNIIDIDSGADVVHPLHPFLTLIPINGLTYNF